MKQTRLMRWRTAGGRWTEGIVNASEREHECRRLAIGSGADVELQAYDYRARAWSAPETYRPDDSRLLPDGTEQRWVAQLCGWKSITRRRGG